MATSTAVSKRGRPKLYSPGTAKDLKKNYDASRRRINIGNQITRWNEFRDLINAKTNEDVAKILLDSYHSISDPPKLASEHLQSTPIQTSKGQCTSTCILPTQPDLSEISASGSNDGTSEIADMEDLHIFPSAKLLKKKSGMVKRKSLSLRHFQKDLSKREEKQRLSCFINPFELTVYSSEEEVSDDDGSSDSDYEPSFNISIGPPKEKGDSDVELGDLVFDLAENEDVDDSETEDHGAGIMKISCPDDAKILTDDQLYLVYLQPLLNLAALQIDPVCNVKLCSSIVKPTTNVRGSAIYIIWVCEKGHQIYKWCSQPVLNRRLHGGDLLISAAILFSGNNYNKVKLFSKFLRLPIVSISSFNPIQRTYLVPSVDEMWAEKQENVLSQFDGQDVVILGHCAQYCTYTVMEESTKKILSCITLDKRQCGGKSANLEKLGFMNSMVKLSENSVRVVEVVTDAHVQISSVMKRQFGHVKHSYDLWHVAKNLGKKILKASQDKTCKSLAGWTKHIINHLWYASEKATTYDQFIGIWLGLIHHVVNEHEWILAYGSEGQNSCLHAPLAEDGRDVEWLEKDSKAHRTLVDIIANKRLLQNVPYFINARTTSELENFQNHILMYASKRFSFSPPVYRARNLLAALDHNEHIDRQPLLTRDGKERYQRVYNKKSQRYTAYTVKSPKTFPHIPPLMEKVVCKRLQHQVGMKRKVVLEADDPRRIAPTLAPAPPSTASIVAEKKSRLGN